MHEVINDACKMAWPLHIAAQERLQETSPGKEQKFSEKSLTDKDRSLVINEFCARRRIAQQHLTDELMFVVNHMAMFKSVIEAREHGHSLIFLYLGNDFEELAPTDDLTGNDSVKSMMHTLARKPQ